MKKGRRERGRREWWGRRKERRMGKGGGGIKEEAEERGEGRRRKSCKGKGKKTASPLTFSHCLSPSASTGTSEPTPCISSPSWVPRILLVSAKPRLSTSQEAEFSHNFYMTFIVRWGSSNELINPVTWGSADWCCKVTYMASLQKMKTGVTHLQAKPNYQCFVLLRWGEQTRSVKKADDSLVNPKMLTMQMTLSVNVFPKLPTWV